MHICTTWVQQYTSPLGCQLWLAMWSDTMDVQIGRKAAKPKVANGNQSGSAQTTVLHSIHSGKEFKKSSPSNTPSINESTPSAAAQIPKKNHQIITCMWKLRKASAWALFDLRLEQTSPPKKSSCPKHIPNCEKHMKYIAIVKKEKTKGELVRTHLQGGVNTYVPQSTSLPLKTRKTYHRAIHDLKATQQRPHRPQLARYGLSAWGPRHCDPQRWLVVFLAKKLSGSMFLRIF